MIWREAPYPFRSWQNQAHKTGFQIWNEWHWPTALCFLFGCRRSIQLSCRKKPPFKSSITRDISKERNVVCLFTNKGHGGTDIYWYLWGLFGFSICCPAMKIKISPAKPHSYWTFYERHMKRIFWLFGSGARTLTACRKLVETARRCEGVYKRQESRARLFAKEEEQRHECAPIFIQKTEQAIQSCSDVAEKVGQTHVPESGKRISSFIAVC